MTERACKNCSYLVVDKDKKACHVVNPGSGTDIEDEDEMVCPKWEKKTLKSTSNQKRGKSKEDIIIYNIVK